MQFNETESLKYAGRFWKICGSNMQLNMHLHAIICINMYFYTCKKKNSHFGFFLNLSIFNTLLNYAGRLCDQICIFIQQYTVLSRHYHHGAILGFPRITPWRCLANVCYNATGAIV